MSGLFSLSSSPSCKSVFADDCAMMVEGEALGTRHAHVIGTILGGALARDQTSTMFGG